MTDSTDRPSAASVSVSSGAQQAQTVVQTAERGVVITETEAEHNPLRSLALERYVFLLLLAIITIAFAWILVPYFGAVFWGVALGILFKSLYRRLFAAFGRRRNLAAIVTVLAIILIVVLPLGLISTALIQQAASVYARIESGDVDFSRYLAQIVEAVPGWLTDLLGRFGLPDLSSLQERLIGSIGQFSQAAARFVAGQAVGFGQNTLHFFVGLGIALYLAFFMLREGDGVVRKMAAAIPLDDLHRRELSKKFATVVRATVKGNVVVALTQGFLGGLAFWYLDIPGALLWGVLMAVLSLLPAVGAGLVWAPVAAYLLATGKVWEGTALIVYGVAVIGLVDNLLRPLLVGKDTKMPDYVVLISTVGGLAVFGLNGFVIGPLIAALFMASWDIMASERAKEPEPAEREIQIEPAAAAPRASSPTAAPADHATRAVRQATDG